MTEQIEAFGDLIKDEQIAAFFEVTLPTARSWMKKMGGFKVGRSWYITKDQLDAYFVRKSEVSCIESDPGNGANTISPKTRMATGRSAGTTPRQVGMARDANRRALASLKRL